MIRVQSDFLVVRASNTIVESERHLRTSFRFVASATEFDSARRKASSPKPRVERNLEGKLGTARGSSWRPAFAQNSCLGRCGKMRPKIRVGKKKTGAVFWLEILVASFHLLLFFFFSGAGEASNGNTLQLPETWAVRFQIRRTVTSF